MPCAANRPRTLSVHCATLSAALRYAPTRNGFARCACRSSAACRSHAAICSLSGKGSRFGVGIEGYAAHAAAGLGRPSRPFSPSVHGPA